MTVEARSKTEKNADVYTQSVNKEYFYRKVCSLLIIAAAAFFLFFLRFDVPLYGDDVGWLVLNNPDSSYLRNIREIFLDENVRKCVLNTPVSVRERSNQLLYLGMQYPEKLLLRMLRVIIRIYDRKK